MLFFDCVRGEFAHCDGSCPESSWHQLRWDPQHTQVECRPHALRCIFFLPRSCWMCLWRTLMPVRPTCCVIHVFLSGLHQFHTSNTTTFSSRSARLQNCVDVRCQADCESECACLFVSSLPCVNMLNDPSLIPTGTQTAPNRFAVTLWSMKIPTTDWCASWRRRCPVWKTSSMPRAWVTSLRVRDHLLGLCGH